MADCRLRRKAANGQPLIDEVVALLHTDSRDCPSPQRDSLRRSRLLGDGIISTVIEVIENGVHGVSPERAWQFGFTR